MNARSISHRDYRPSNAMPLEVGVIHFVGIGGIGMSGIAEILHNLGYKVSGSDVAENANVLRLREMGIVVHIGHAKANVEGVAVVVKSTAVPMDNPEIEAAREQQIPVVKRSEMLAELTHLKATIAVAGSHGKTTTTSMVGHVLEAAELDPTVINGGIINAYGTNAYLGSGEWLIAEADESDGTFIRMPSTIGIITNLDPEHLDHWGSFEALKTAFRTFIENQPFYGFAVVCFDDEDVKALVETIMDRRIIAYGIESEDVDLRAVNIRQDVSGSTFDVEVSARVTGGEDKVFKDVTLPTPGLHNVSNALAAIGVGLEMKLPEETVIHAINQFSGVKRRFTKTGEVNGISVIDDYGHHPKEISATLAAAKSVVKDSGRVIAVMQPHRYSRLAHLFDDFANCFSNADQVIVTEVYAAGEQPIKGVNEYTLVDNVNKHGVPAQVLSSREELATVVAGIAQPGDMVVCLGAGSISAWANALPDELKALENTSVCA